MRSTLSILAAPAFCLAVLGGVAVENRTHNTPEDAAPYHARAKAALEAWPQNIGDEWKSGPLEVPEAAVRLLRPNAIISRRYVDARSGGHATADLLVVQCSESEDMDGHYPPNCYPAAGQPMISQTRRDWEVRGRPIKGVEYQFEASSLGPARRTCVYGFFVVPGRGVVPEMKDVRNAYADYQRRVYGAAQFQVVFPAEMLVETRDEIFATIIGANVAALDALNQPGR